MAKERLAPPTVSRAVGPWEQGVKVGNLLFISGQTPMSPEGEVVGKGDAAAQTRQVMENMRAMCEAGDARLRAKDLITSLFSNQISLVFGSHSRKLFNSQSLATWCKLPFLYLG